MVKQFNCSYTRAFHFFALLFSSLTQSQWMDLNITCKTLLEKWQGHTHQHIYPCMISNLSWLLIFIALKHWLPFPLLVKIILLNFWAYYLFHQYVRNYHAIYLTEQIKPFKRDLSWFLVTSHNIHIFSEEEKAIYSLYISFPDRSSYLAHLSFPWSWFFC